MARRMTLVAEALVRGAVDLYVHCEPDLLRRRASDLALATECAAAGYRAALHRHHFSSTVERSAVASEATGFDLFGAVLLNDSLGGLNPWAAELALRLGGRWIGLPTLSAKAFRDGLAAMPAALRSTLDFGPGRLTLTDDGGDVRVAVTDILELARHSNVPVNIGYPSLEECRATIAAAHAVGGVDIVLTNPHSSMRLTDDEVVELTGQGRVHLELPAYSMHPEGPSRRDPAPALDRAAALISRVGSDRCVLSSDGGMADAPPPHVMLAFALAELQRRGVPDEQLGALVHTNPGRLLRLQ